MSPPERILIIHDGPDDYLTALTERFPHLKIEMIGPDETIPEAISRVDPTIAMSFRAGRFPGPTQGPIFDAPNLKWFHSGGVGIDHLPQWDSTKLTVTNAAGVSGKYMAETVTGAVLMLNFGFPKHIQNQRQKIWEQKEWSSLDQKTALVIGLGGIGEKVAERLQSFGMYVIGARNSDKPSFSINEQINTTEIHETLPRADFVCIHVPNTSATRHLVNTEFLKAMKTSAYLINTARGAQVNDDALVDALQNKTIAGAYLDVFTEEPLGGVLNHLSQITVAASCSMDR